MKWKRPRYLLLCHTLSTCSTRQYLSHPATTLCASVRTFLLFLIPPYPASLPCQSASLPPALPFFCALRRPLPLSLHFAVYCSSLCGPTPITRGLILTLCTVAFSPACLPCLSLATSSPVPVLPLPSSTFYCLSPLARVDDKCVSFLSGPAGSPGSHKVTDVTKSGIPHHSLSSPMLISISCLRSVWLESLE